LNPFLSSLRVHLQQEALCAKIVPVGGVFAMDGRQPVQKPSVEELAQAAGVLAERLTECVHVYKHNVDVFMSEAERQRKTDQTISVLQRLHSLLDQAEMPAEFISNIEENDEKLAGGFEVMFRETLKILSGLSVDMQKLLKSSWMKSFPSKIAEVLFFGEGDERKGIGSGNPEHGRLPGVLAELLEREEVGETRFSREDYLSDEPRRHDKEGRQRWIEQNSGYLRTAGKVE
jgi:hypothetical protein